MPGTTPITASELVAALQSQDMTLVDQIELRSGPPVHGMRSGNSGELEVDLASDEGAVVLLEQDGMFSWNFPAFKGASAPDAVGIRAAPGRRTARFTIQFQAAPPAGAQRRGLVADFLFDRARAFVLKFATGVAVSGAVNYLEHNVRRCLVVMDSEDPQTWRAVDNLSGVKLPDDRSARVLLFVHGTFSSTVGSFGGLGATPWGRSFLAAVRANYDAVIGFDHATLADDPLVNAVDLLQRLQGRPWQHTPCFDAVSYSRGGIVLRSLLEHVLPGSSWKPRFERSIFVGAVNGGTELATPENWHTLVDLYTNLAAAACRTVALLPQVTFAATLLREAIQSVGALVKHLAVHVVTDGGIPGLAAMEPKGDFIRTLNQTQLGQPAPEDSQFFAITSNFSPQLMPDSAKDLPRQLVLSLCDGFVDRLMGEENDLVVNKSSMTAIDVHAGNFIKDKLDYGSNGVVYHTNYFLQPQTANALTRWLRLQSPATASPARSRSAIQTGGASRLEVPARVDTDVIMLRADAPATEAREELLRARPSYCVIERVHQGSLLRYAFPAEEVLARTIRRPRATLLQALDLHEFQASRIGSVTSLPLHDRPAAHPIARRVVAMENDLVVGVVADEVIPLTAEQLSVLAQQATAPKTECDYVVRRRGLPTFAPAPPPTAEVTPAKPADTPPKVTCHFHAEMDGEVEFGSIATVTVTVSRETIERAVRAGAAGGKAAVDPSRKLILQLVPKLNFECVGENRVELDPPSPGEPREIYFDAKPTRKCEGEIWIVVRQGQVPLVTLILKVKIVQKKSGAPHPASATARTAEAPPLAEPVHELSIFEQRHGDEVSYQFHFDSPILGLKNVYPPVKIVGNRDDYVKALYREIEQRWLSNANDKAAFQEELRAYGGQLWDELIPPALQRDLWQHRGRIESVWVFSEEPFIPWELVHMKEPGKPLGNETLFLGQKGVVRWLHNIGLPPDQLRARAGRCRYVIPDYPHPDFRLPQALQEAAFLEEKFGASRVDPFPDPVRKLLAGPAAFDLLHFACHGIADHDDIANAQLLLQGRVEGSDYQRDYLSATTVRQFANLACDDGVRPMVVVNACQAARAGYNLSGIGGFARAFLPKPENPGQGAGLFIGCLWSVGDSPARHFTEEFYRRLLAGDTVSAASVRARAVAQQAGEATWLAYVVYGHPQAKL